SPLCSRYSESLAVFSSRTGTLGVSLCSGYCKRSAPVISPPCTLIETSRTSVTTCTGDTPPCGAAPNVPVTAGALADGAGAVAPPPACARGSGLAAFGTELARGLGAAGALTADCVEAAVTGSP